MLQLFQREGSFFDTIHLLTALRAVVLLGFCADQLSIRRSIFLLGKKRGHELHTKSTAYPAKSITSDSSKASQVSRSFPKLRASQVVASVEWIFGPLAEESHLTAQVRVLWGRILPFRLLQYLVDRTCWFFLVFNLPSPKFTRSSWLQRALPVMPRQQPSHRS